MIKWYNCEIIKLYFQKVLKKSWDPDPIEYGSERLAKTDRIPINWQDKFSDNGVVRKFVRGAARGGGGSTHINFQLEAC